MKTNTSTVNLEPIHDDEEGELSSATGCLIFLGVVILIIAFMVAFVAQLFNPKMF